MKVINVNADYFESHKVNDFEKLNDKQKYELALADDINFSIWDDIKSFECDLNSDLVNIENGFCYFLND